MSFVLPAPQQCCCQQLGLAGRGGDGWDFKGTLKGLETPLRVFRCQTATSFRLRGFSLSHLLSCGEHSLSAMSAQAWGVSASLQSSLGRRDRQGRLNHTRDSCNIPLPGAMESSAVIPARAVGGGAELEGQQ